MFFCFFNSKNKDGLHQLPSSFKVTVCCIKDCVKLTLFFFLPRKITCRYHLRTGYCPFNTDCLYKHDKYAPRFYQQVKSLISVGTKNVLPVYDFFFLPIFNKYTDDDSDDEHDVPAASRFNFRLFIAMAVVDGYDDDNDEEYRPYLP